MARRVLPWNVFAVISVSQVNGAKRVLKVLELTILRVPFTRTVARS